MRLGSASALGATAAGTTVSDGATLDLNGQTVAAEAINLSGAGVGGLGSLINSNTGTAASLAGSVTLAAASSIGGGGDLTLSGVIDDGVSDFALTKDRKSVV